LEASGIDELFNMVRKKTKEYEKARLELWIANREM
jgi:hypothetical protein